MGGVTLPLVGSAIAAEAGVGAAKNRRGAALLA